MPQYGEDIVAVISKLADRVKKLELSQLTVDTTVEDVSLAITGLSASAFYYIDGVGNQKAEVTFSWNAIDVNDPDNLEEDKINGYMFSITKSTDANPGLYSLTKNTTVTINNLSPGVNVTGRVYALTVRGVSGPVASVTASVATDLTPPPQPAMPVLQATTGGVRGTFSGLTSTGAAMPKDFSHCIVQTSSDNVTFANYTVVQSNSSFFIPANGNYSTIYVRLLSVDNADNINISVPSTVANAVPTKLNTTDLGVVLPGNIAFTDADNLVIDGSFESDIVRQARTALLPNGVTFYNGLSVDYHGDWCLRFATVAGTANMYLNSYGNDTFNAVSVTQGSKILLTCMGRGVSSNGTLSLIAEYRLNDGTTYTETVVTQSTWDGNWQVIEGITEAPASAAYLSCVVQVNTNTVGNIYVDAVQVRRVVTSALIENGAITNLKVAYGAITTAHIEEVDIGVAGVGKLRADMFDSSIITTQMIAVGAITPGIISSDFGSGINIGANPNVANKASVSDLTNLANNVDGITNDVTSIKNTVIIDGNGVSISKAGSICKVVLDNTSLNFNEGTSVVAKISGQKMIIKATEIQQQLTVGVHTIEKYDANNTLISWTG